ncbi:HlyD family secretion protein [Brumimicrobium glaciale]|uniref:HlyD family secretion protein n=1 Tax=Brumimicrobium glaciale TaxID=200475 RepID=A0A4Q4KS58_9FLAO|nr:HlyD family secretion protein [Brumimicrobium glaciale]
MAQKENIKNENELSVSEKDLAMECANEKIQAKKKKTRAKTLFANIMVFVIIAGGFFWLVRGYFHIGDKNFTNAAQVEEFINPLNSRVSAYIQEIRFIEHDHVQKGDTLIILDNREILTQVAQAEAAYENALAAKGVTSSTVNTVSNSVNVTSSNIAGAKARMENAQKNLDRYENLVESQAVTRFQYDQVKTEFDMAQAGYNSLISQKESAGLSVTEVKGRLSLNDAEIQRAKAALDMANLNLSYTIITAPYDGIMGRRTIQEGQLLQQPGMPVGSIIKKDNKWVTANFLETQMPNIEVGQKMKMTADAIGDNEFEGVVTAISGATGSRYSMVPTDNSSGNFVKVQQRIPVRIEFTEDNDVSLLDKLKAGMNLNVYLKL